MPPTDGAGRASRLRVETRTAPRLRAAGILLVLALGCAIGPGARGKGQPVPDPQARAASVGRGKPVYLQDCAPCHGETGEGNGPLAAELDPPPTDLVASGVHVSVKGLEVAIEIPHYSSRLLGQRVTSGNREMPAWKDLLTPQQIDDVVAYVGSLIEAHEDPLASD